MLIRLYERKTTVQVPLVAFEELTPKGEARSGSLSKTSQAVFEISKTPKQC